MQSELKIMQDMVEVGKRMYSNGFVASNDGNISVRTGENEILTTPHGVSKGYMTTEMICKVNLNGEPLQGTYKPSSEIQLHLGVYKNRPDVKAVVHAHPPTATGFAVAGIALDSHILPEIIIRLGEVPLCGYATPSTSELAGSVLGYIQRHDAFLLANHGALTIGADLFDAYYKMESLELYARISLVARQLGGERQLTPAQIQKLMEIRQGMGLQGRHPFEEKTE